MGIGVVSIQTVRQTPPRLCKAALTQEIGGRSVFFDYLHLHPKNAKSGKVTLERFQKPTTDTCSAKLRQHPAGQHDFLRLVVVGILDVADETDSLPMRFG